MSTAAVSLCLSGDPAKLRRVGADTQERIRSAATRLGYVHNRVASQLRKARSDRICVVLPRLGMPFSDQIAREFESAAIKSNLSTIVVTANDEHDWQRVIRDVESGLADGIFAYADGMDPDVVERVFQPLVDSRRPCMILHPDARPAGLSTVNFRRRDALVDALEHLVANEHRKLAYVCQERGVTSGRRLATLNDFFAARQETHEMPFVLPGAKSRKAAVQAVDTILQLQDRPTAIVTESDFSAVAIIHELQRKGFSVPDDFAVVGCGNVESGLFCNPRLTTIGPQIVSFRAEAEHLVEWVLGNAEPKVFFSEWKLYVRESG